MCRRRIEKYGMPLQRLPCNDTGTGEPDGVIAIRCYCYVSVCRYLFNILIMIDFLIV